LLLALEGQNTLLWFGGAKQCGGESPIKPSPKDVYDPDGRSTVPQWRDGSIPSLQGERFSGGLENAIRRNTCQPVRAAFNCDRPLGVASNRHTRNA
jgi:hypothetical protein